MSQRFEFLGQRIICGACGGVTEILFGEDWDAVWNRGEGRCQNCVDAGRTRVVETPAEQVATEPEQVEQPALDAPKKRGK